jgi:hypothetical protein
VVSTTAVDFSLTRQGAGLGLFHKSEQNQGIEIRHSLWSGGINGAG